MGSLAPVDWSIIIGYIALVIGLGVFLSKRATQSTESYFIAGRKLPWWLLGTSIVATTFAADTPLAVSGLVRTKGIAGNWYWWNMAMVGMLGVFFYARFWRRSKIITDTQFAELRYSGKSASILRGFRALYFPLIYNTIVMGWVMLAMAKIMGGILGLPKWQAVGVCFVIAIVYTSLSGLWGVVITDFIEFCTAMFTSILLAVIAVNRSGGMANVLANLTTMFGADKAKDITAIVPLHSALLPIGFFFIYIGLQWWTSGNTDGGSYFAQRMLSAKNEKHARLGFLWGNIAHYCVRTWPWIVVGLVAIVAFPHIKDPEMGYIQAMLKFLPTGLLGLALAGFLAAFLSTIDTQLNWGASYLINDFYRRFLVKDASEKHYVKASIIATLIIAAIGALVTFMMTSIYGAWTIITSVNAGIGVVYLLRWYWWRINAWSEMSAISASVIMSACLAIFTEIQFPMTLVYIIPVSVSVWLIVTFLTPPTSNEKLIEFYKQIRPGGPGWKRIRAQIPGTENDRVGWSNLKGWIAAVIAIYAALIGVGKLILGQTLIGIILLCVTAGMGYLIYSVFTATEKTTPTPLG
jgi:SSS family solute:Na+ symporter